MLVGTAPNFATAAPPNLVLDKHQWQRAKCCSIAIPAMTMLGGCPLAVPHPDLVGVTTVHGNKSPRGETSIRAQARLPSAVSSSEMRLHIAPHGLTAARHP
jgi:hypothetical protein